MTKEPICKGFRRIAVLFISLAFALPGLSQIYFGVGSPEGSEAEDRGVAALLVQKTEQILTRNSAAAAKDKSCYVLIPSLTVNSVNSTNGTLQKVTTVSGEFTLTAVKVSDGMQYYSVSVPVKTSTRNFKDGTEAQVLIKAVKPTDVKFTRFIRLARKKIEELKTDSCSQSCSH